jgi:hypothetical protein
VIVYRGRRIKHPTAAYAVWFALHGSRVRKNLHLCQLFVPKLAVFTFPRRFFHEYLIDV